VNLIHENPRYTKMTPEEILGKFVSGRMMVKEARYVDDALNGPLPIYEPQPVALKATSSKEALPSKVAQVEAAGLNEDEMALIVKRFKTALKGCKEYPNKNKTREKRSCFKCGKTGHFIAQCPDNDNDQGQEKARRRNGRLCLIWKEITHQTCYSGCPVAHRTVRCATQQKARIAFHVDLQRLLAALGL
jgi:hypothetical protein